MNAAISQDCPRALAGLAHHRWALPILALTAKEKGCKFITLSKRLGVAPHTLKRALPQLQALDLVVPNPHYGHPLRPEYILGERGKEVAGPADALWRWIYGAGLEQPILKKWSLPTLAAVGMGATRFNEIRTLLNDATPRATALALKDLVSSDLAARRIDDGYPPTPLYGPTRRTRTALPHIYALGEPLVRALTR